MKIYFDVCSLCRPFDEHIQPQTHLEAEAVLALIRQCRDNDWTIAASEIIDIELARVGNIEKLLQIRQLYGAATDYLEVTDEVKQLSKQFQTNGIKLFDSLHLALAESNHYDYLLTTDIDFLRTARKLKLNVAVRNPVELLLEDFENE
ncbi:hypothetical protein FACS1894189_4150 [Planctomycetales bacterium]|nr:hypothetical protein FACS1894189_4150 [Planctomycetales bacterium]